MSSTSVIANIALVRGERAMKGRFKTARVRDGAVAFEVRAAALRNPRQSGHRFRRKAATGSDRKRPANPKEGGHPVDRVRRGALSAI
jgi:hypothetical protein